ncbi:hypothetical protein [Palleronia caenipelagi]|uniref:Uncharacterized protein n=1 Tax=Palleronia caenipelagi TaxID=2489174 RepID=A0A547PUG0_9RHOB|nr:hypothetical protein [Palleronia caenipelagi]TRD17776.1 hypothetical protein FEV53_12450 [Palleronia caenipelagi]
MGPDEALTSQKSFYVQISRARDEALLFTSDSDKLAARIQETTGVRQDALSTWRDAMKDDLAEASRAADAARQEAEKARKDPEQTPEKDASQERSHEPSDAKDKTPETERKDPFDHARELAETVRERQKDMSR